MKSVKFQKLSIQNFLSIGKSPVEIEFSEGITIITGENLDNIGSRNGIGKSAILNAIYWVIFGETIGELKKQQIQNNITKGECSVLLTLVVDGSVYTIKRVLEPSSVTITKDGSDLTISTIPKNDEYIQKLLGVNQQVFKNSVIVTSEKTIPFMAQKKVEKRNFVEGVMNLNFFSDMLKSVRNDYNEKKKESDTEVALFTAEQKNLENLKVQKVTNAEAKKKKIKELNDRIDANKEEIVALQAQDTNVEEALAENQKLIEETEKSIQAIKDDARYKELPSVIQDLKSKISEKKIRIEAKKKEIDDLKTVNAVCPTCKRAYSESTCDPTETIKDITADIFKIVEEIKQIEVDKVAADKELSKFDTDLTNFEAEVKKIKLEIDRLSGLDNKIKIIEAKNEEILKNIKATEEETDGIDELIEGSGLKIKNYQENIKVLHKDLEILEMSKEIVSENGIKSVIIKKNLSFLNGRLNYYLNLLDAPCRCEFNETFDVDMKNINGTEIGYYNLSGGEKKRLDTSIIFMWRDFLKLNTGISFNLFMADEAFDSALDQKAQVKILEILRDGVRKNLDAVYIISHNKNVTNFDIDNTINVIKKGGITSLDCPT